jgi:hypothetical protein
MGGDGQDHCAIPPVDIEGVGNDPVGPLLMDGTGLVQIDGAWSHRPREDGDTGLARRRQEPARGAEVQRAREGLAPPPLHALRKR